VDDGGEKTHNPPGHLLGVAFAAFLGGDRSFTKLFEGPPFSAAPYKVFWSGREACSVDPR